MSHPPADGEVSAILCDQDSVEPLMVGTTTARFVATGSVTNGHFGLFQWNMSAAVGGAGAHYHRTFTESFYVLSGSVKLFDGARLGPGVRRRLPVRAGARHPRLPERVR